MINFEEKEIVIGKRHRGSSWIMVMVNVLTQVVMIWNFCVNSFMFQAFVYVLFFDLKVSTVAPEAYLVYLLSPGLMALGIGNGGYQGK